MTTAEYNSALAKLRLNPTQAARVLGFSKRQSFRYSNGAEVPATVVKLLNAYLRHGLPPST